MLDSGAESLVEELGAIGKTIPATAVVLLAVSVSRAEDQPRVLVARDASVASALRLVTRLASCCGGNIRAEMYAALLSLLSGGKTRPMSREQLVLFRCLRFQGLQQESLLGAISTPEFVHPLVMFGLLGADGVDLSYGDKVVVCGSEHTSADAVAVLERVSMYVLTTNGLDAGISGPWSALLCPLKVCEWRGGPGAGTGGPDSMPHSILSFTTLLEDVCAGSPGASCARTAFGLSLVLGCFHASPAVRARCAARLHYELVGPTGPGVSFPACTSASDASGIGLGLGFGAEQTQAGRLDPFGDAAAMRLQSWAQLQMAPNPLKPSYADARPAVPSRLANHTECRKLASIAFSAAHEVSIRSTAMRQMLQVMYPLDYVHICILLHTWHCSFFIYFTSGWCYPLNLRLTYRNLNTIKIHNNVTELCPITLT